jgi:hypothetical protein
MPTRDWLKRAFADGYIHGDILSEVPYGERLKRTPLEVTTNHILMWLLPEQCTTVYHVPGSSASCSSSSGAGAA